MANRQRDPAKEAYWRGVLERCAASELSVRAFCQREQVSEASFYTWRRTIAERDGTAFPPRLSFVPAVVTDDLESDASVAMADAPCRTSIAIELAGGCVLKFAGPNSTEQLADLIIALQSRGRT
jgi:hypothetical protein